TRRSERCRPIRASGLLPPWWRLRRAPYLRVLCGDQRPDPVPALCERAHPVGLRAAEHELMRDGAAGGVGALFGVGEAQRDPVAEAPEHLGLLIADGAEQLGVGEKRIFRPARTQEAEPPGAAARGPEQAHRLLLVRTCSSSALSRARRNPVSTAVMRRFFALAS